MHVRMIPGTPWWKDMSYCIGNLTSKTRALRVVNILSSQEQLIEVCTEESMNEIQKRCVHRKSVDPFRPDVLDSSDGALLTPLPSVFGGFVRRIKCLFFSSLGEMGNAHRPLHH